MVKLGWMNDTEAIRAGGMTRLFAGVSAALGAASAHVAPMMRKADRPEPRLGMSAPQLLDWYPTHGSPPTPQGGKARKLQAPVHLRAKMERWQRR